MYGTEAEEEAAYCCWLRCKFGPRAVGSVVLHETGLETTVCDNTPMCQRRRVVEGIAAFGPRHSRSHWGKRASYRMQYTEHLGAQ